MMWASVSPDSPQLNPVENMWQEIGEKSYPNLTFESMEQLEMHLAQARMKLENEPQPVESIAGFQWIVSSLYQTAYYPTSTKERHLPYIHLKGKLPGFWFRAGNIGIKAELQGNWTDYQRPVAYNLPGTLNSGGLGFKGFCEPVNRLFRKRLAVAGYAYPNLWHRFRSSCINEKVSVLLPAPSDSFGISP